MFAIGDRDFANGNAIIPTQGIYRTGYFIGHITCKLIFDPS